MAQIVHPTDVSLARNRTWPETYDERKARQARERALARYIDAHGEPSGDGPRVLAHLDACERLECDCEYAAPWFCHSAVKAHDGRCSCACHAAAATPAMGR